MGETVNKAIHCQNMRLLGTGSFSVVFKVHHIAPVRARKKTTADLDDEEEKDGDEEKKAKVNIAQFVRYCFDPGGRLFQILDFYELRVWRTPRVSFTSM